MPAAPSLEQLKRALNLRAARREQQALGEQRRGRRRSSLDTDLGARAAVAGLRFPREGNAEL